MIDGHPAKKRVRVTREHSNRIAWLFVDGKAVMSGLNRYKMARLAVKIRQAIGEQIGGRLLPPPH